MTSLNSKFSRPYNVLPLYNFITSTVYTMPNKKARTAAGWIHYIYEEHGVSNMSHYIVVSETALDTALIAETAARKELETFLK